MRMELDKKSFTQQTMADIHKKVIHCFEGVRGLKFKTEEDGGYRRFPEKSDGGFY